MAIDDFGFDLGDASPHGFELGSLNPTVDRLQGQTSPAPPANDRKRLLTLAALIPLIAQKGGRVGIASFLAGLQQAQQRKQALTRQEQLDLQTQQDKQAALDINRQRADQQGEQLKAAADLRAEAQRAKTNQEGVRKMAIESIQAGGDPRQAMLMAAGEGVTLPTGVVPNTDKRGFVAKDITLNGKRMTANYDPDSGNYYALGDTKTPLTGNILEYQKPTAQQSTSGSTDAKDIADAIERGEQPPVTTGLFRLAGPVRAELAKRGYNLASANLDWQATQRHLSTLNNAQQTRMAQAIDNAAHSLDVIDQLSAQWKGGRFPILNKANLAVAKNGAYGRDAASIATQLEAQISDVTSELGNVYMGGNSPTDHALGLAAKNLSANWDDRVLRDMTKLARTNLQIRQNSIRNTGVAGASPTNPYAPQAQPAATAAPKRLYYDANGHPITR